jgi:hypothetical protein
MLTSMSEDKTRECRLDNGTRLIAIVSKDEFLDKGQTLDGQQMVNSHTKRLQLHNIKSCSVECTFC